MEEKISLAFRNRGLSPKKFQVASIRCLLKGEDIFVSVPTGSGKTYVYAFLSQIAASLHMPHRVIVVTPLISLMQDQVRRMNQLGISSAFVEEAQKDDAVKQGVLSGDYDIVFMSPESATNSKWRDLFLSKLYQRELMTIVIDECHCISQWLVAIYSPIFLHNPFKNKLSNNKK